MRAVLGDSAESQASSAAAHDWETDTVAVLETNVDDLSPEILGQFVAKALAEGAQGAVVRGSPYFSSVQRRLIIDSAAEHRLPAIYERRDDAERGGLVSYAPNVEDQYRATAEYVVRILAGENPGELPIQQPTKFEMVINLKTAKALGIEIAPILLARADEVIE